jgi:hypothetical protein
MGLCLLANVPVVVEASRAEHLLDLQRSLVVEMAGSLV